MPKNYQRRIDKALDACKANEYLHEVVWDDSDAAADVGEMFQMIAYDLENMRPESDSIRRLFATAGLSAWNPFHWAELLHIFAEVHYEKGTPGHPIWNGPERKEMLSEKLHELALKTGDYRMKRLAQSFIELQPRPIPSLKTAKAVLNVARQLKIKLRRPKRSARGSSPRGRR